MENEIDKQIEESMKRFTEDCKNIHMINMFTEAMKEQVKKSKYPYGAGEKWEVEK